MAVSAPTTTLSETKNHSSNPYQNKLKDQKYGTAFPPHSIPLAILEMLLPNHAVVKNLEKASTREYLSTTGFLKALHSLNKKLQPPSGQGDKQRMGDGSVP